MAASPTKPSVDAIDDPCNAGKEDKISVGDTYPEHETDVATHSTKTGDGVAPTPSYMSSELSEAYLEAKKFLAAGDFESALSKIGEGIELNRAALESLRTSDQYASVDLHESFAPFHYLYGTTLLYSIEESTESQQVTTEQSTGKSSEEDSKSAETPSAFDPTQAGVEGTPDDSTDDMEIAWENLEAARMILQIMLEKGHLSDSMDEKKLDADLAQIFLREGDLGRMNGRYLDAIEDYSKSLMHRLRSIKSNEDHYDRTIADVHYSLGLTYLTSSSELKKHITNPGENDGCGGEMDQDSRDKLSEEHRIMGVSHYIECSKALCGRIALLSGADPDAIINGVGKVLAANGAMKTTGMDEGTIKLSDASANLAAMRKRVAELTPKTAGDTTTHDLREFLDEIQENIDEAEKAQDAVRQVSELKVKAQNEAAQLEEGGAAKSADGVTTTIGFGGKKVLSPTSSGASSIMVVRKKNKKRDASADAKLPPDNAEPTSSKRAKTE